MDSAILVSVRGAPQNQKLQRDSNIEGNVMTERKKQKSLTEKIGHVFAEKQDSFWPMVMIFFTMSLTGWVWEVCLHLISEGRLVNRGLLHGPWLPLYGYGSILILTVLHRLRKKPLLEFLAIVLLCGCLEYGISWFLEQAYDGMRWWDYSDYFLNLNGRICVEGLLAFGIGGMAIVYVYAPFLDRLFRRIPKKILVMVCLVLILIFSVDLIYSCKNPNLGNGIARCCQ